jgi:hypothetical protein
MGAAFIPDIEDPRGAAIPNGPLPLWKGLDERAEVVNHSICFSDKVSDLKCRSAVAQHLAMLEDRHLFTEMFHYRR